jgi:phage terminase large subunit-like protein
VGWPVQSLVLMDRCGTAVKWLMFWTVANAHIEPKGTAIITKQASGSTKIDPLMDAYNSIALMSTNPWSTRPTIFMI